MAYCPLSLHRTGLQNNLSIFIDRVAGQRTKEGYHPPLEKPFFCSRFSYVGKRKASEERVIQLLTSAGFSWNEGLFGKRLLMRRCYIVKRKPGLRSKRRSFVLLPHMLLPMSYSVGFVNENADHPHAGR
ncbi:uncharacterized protein DS421_18g609890 [Arachis hypogaea]|nr:uncharacterized protein DS421_18g609890 [Arachis hypogaea]